VTVPRRGFRLLVLDMPMNHRLSNRESLVLGNRLTRSSKVSVCRVGSSNSGCSRFLCERPAFVASASPGPVRSALQKRLQRTHKFLLLVDVFRPFVLNVVPKFSVSRLDIVKLDDLHKLDSNESNEQVRSIVRKLELAEAMQVSWVTVTLEPLHVS
jgi:hypothetical protein